MTSCFNPFQTLAPQNEKAFWPLLVVIRGASKSVSQFLKFTISRVEFLVILFIVSFIIYNILHQKIIEYSIEDNAFSIFIGLQNGNENVFHGLGNLVIWLWKSCGNFFKGICTNPVDLCDILESSVFTGHTLSI